MIKTRRSISIVGALSILFSATTVPAFSGPDKKSIELKTPSNIVVTPIAPGGKFTVSWSAVTNATSYSVRVYNAAGTALSGSAIPSVSSPLEVTRTPNTSYQVSVQAIRDVSNFSKSSESEKRPSKSDESRKFPVTTFATSYTSIWNDNCPPSGSGSCTQAHIGGASTYTTGSAVTIPTTAPTAAGYAFDSWNTQANGLGATVNNSYVPITPYGAKTFYAKWTAISLSYALGDTGPGGGIIYYYDSAGFNCGVGFTITGSPTGGLCHYLEVAPSGWNTGADPTKVWAISANQGSNVPDITDDSFPYNNALGIGLGYKNSDLIVTQNGAYNASSNDYAAGAARAYAGGSKNDWYLPTTAELNLLCQWDRGVAPSVTTPCDGGSLNSSTYGATSAGFVGDYYWSSSEYFAIVAWFQFFGGGFQSGYGKGGAAYVRPVRAF